MTNTTDTINPDATDSRPSGANASDIRVVQAISSLARNAGGPSQSITGLCEHLARAGCKVDLCSIDTPASLGGAVEVDTSLLDLHLANLDGKLSSVFIPAPFRDMLTSHAAQCDIVHSHGLWQPTNRCAGAVADELAKPHVITIRGMLSPRAMQRSAWKKRIASLLFAKRMACQAACLNVLTLREMQDARAFGAKNPIAVIPNGICLPDLSSLPDKSEAQSRLGDLPNKRLILFLGRIHPIKNIDGLIEAWSQLADEFDDWHLVIAGPDEVGQLGDLKEQVSQAGLDERVTFKGPAFGEDKQTLMGAADIYIQPSHTEGFSMAILEAMACGLPVAISSECNFDEVAAANAGSVTGTDGDSIAEGLRRLLTLDESKLSAMGNRGRSLIEREYSWNTIAAKMMAVYNWLLDRAPMPDCVRLD